MSEVERIHLEPKHLVGKDGNGKGSQRRHGEDTEAYRRNFDLTIGTTYWIDMSLAAITGGNASVTTVDAVALETT